MPIDILEKKLEKLSESQKQSVFDYINFLIFQNSSNNTSQIQNQRTPGGLDGVILTEDFDETPDCFKEYY